MRDRSRMTPEKSLFSSDERTLEQRYEDVRQERDELKLKLRELTELMVDVCFGNVQPDRLLMRMYLRERGVKKHRPFGDLHRDGNAKPEERAVVYYLEMNSRVKIGFTTSFVQRMQTFYVQPAQVLAVEQGGRTLENARHNQFRATRIKGSEMFTHSKDLDQHIAALRADQPNPWEAGCRLTGLVL